MFDNLREDTRRLKSIKRKPFPWYVLESLLFENGYQAVVLYRIAHWFKSRGIPLFGPFFHRLSMFLTGVDIAPGARIGPGLMISHGTGLVIGDQVEISARALLLHQVTLGGPSLGRRGEMPKIGDDVFIGAGVRVIGGIEIGDNVFIGVNTVVARNIPDNSKVVAIAETRIVRRPPRRDSDSESSQ